MRAGVSISGPVDLLVPAVGVVLLLNTIGFPCLVVAVESGVKLNAVLDVPEGPELLRSVASDVVGNELVEGGLHGLLELRVEGLSRGESDCASHNQEKNL